MNEGHNNTTHIRSNPALNDRLVPKGTWCGIAKQVQAFGDCDKIIGAKMVKNRIGACGIKRNDKVGTGIF